MNAELFTPTASRLRPRLLLLARQYDAAAEDAVQEAMMRLWQVWGELPEVADARCLGILTEAAAIESIDLQEKAIHILLGFIHGDAASFKVRRQKRPGVLVETAHAGNTGIII